MGLAKHVIDIFFINCICFQPVMNPPCVSLLISIIATNVPEMLTLSAAMKHKNKSQKNTDMHLS